MKNQTTSITLPLIIVCSIIFTVVSLCGSLVGATVYYVDSISGDDGDDGTTINSAWQTFEAIHNKIYGAEAFIAGDSILFKRGQSWQGNRLAIEEIHGTASSPIIFGAYGAGAKPVFNLIVPQNLSWEHQSDNIWKASNPPGYHPERLLKNGVEILRANNSGELGSTFLWLYEVTDSSNELYLYSLDDPGDATIEYNAVNPNNSNASLSPIIISDSSHILIENLDIQGGWTGIHIAEGVNNIRIYNLQIGKYSSNGINIYSGENIVIDNCDFNNHFTLDYSMGATTRESSKRGSGDGIVIYGLAEGVIKHSSFTNWGHASINIDGGPEIQVSGVRIFDNTLTSPDICYGGRIAVDDAHHCELFNNRIIDTSVQSQLNGHSNHYHHNIFINTRSSPLNINNEIDAGIDVADYSNTAVYGNTYENNLVANTEGVGIQLSGNNLRPVHDNIFRNNIVYNCGLLPIPRISGIGITIASNEDPDIPTSDNHFLTNLVYNDNTEDTYSFRGTISNAKGFNQFNGSDGFTLADNIGANPLFKDMENGDYQLEKASPCRNAGTETLAILDYYGNTVPIGIRPDIGIHELNELSSILLFIPALLHLRDAE